MSWQDWVLLTERLFVIAVCLIAAVVVWGPSRDPQKVGKALATLGLGIIIGVEIGVVFTDFGALKPVATYWIAPGFVMSLAGLTIILWRERVLHRLGVEAIRSRIE